MNETLSDAEIKNYKGFFNWKEHGPQWTNKAMQKALNTIEALKENSIQEAALSAKFCAESEAKDAKIKQLVEALGEIENTWTEDYQKNEDGFNEPSRIATKALSTLPDVEGYRLEREVYERFRDVRNEWAITSEFIETSLEQGLTDTIGWSELSEVVKASEALEAHREKVKNDA